MGLIYANIELRNPSRPDLQPLAVEALVDTGAVTLCIPQHVAVQLDLHEIEQREVTTADERSHVVPYVGPLQVGFHSRRCFTGALVIGETVLLGAIPMEDMDLVISPSRQTITVNPKSPNLPSAVVKRIAPVSSVPISEFRVPSPKLRCSVFDVGCSMFVPSLPTSDLRPLPPGRGLQTPDSRLSTFHPQLLPNSQPQRPGPETFD